MSLAPVIVELRTGTALFQGILASIFAVLVLALLALVATSGRLDGQTMFLGGCLFLIVAAYGVHSLGVAIRKPVALRMDAHGISGYFAEPAVWPEILNVEAFEGSKGARYLGFAFLNPEMIRDRQTAWRKFSNWSRSPGYRYQIVISQELLLDHDVETLATLARAFHRAA